MLMETWPAEVGRLDDCADVVAVLEALELVGHGTDAESATDDLKAQLDALTWH
jgi:hypothetical protein